MPTSGEGRFAADTSVAVAALDASHAAHLACRRRVIETDATLAGHAAFETFSVLTRMPGVLRLDAPTAHAAILAAFPEISPLDGTATVDLFRRLGAVGITGGAVYDALVGEAARRDERVLLTRDRRAARTYDLLGVTWEYVE